MFIRAACKGCQNPVPCWTRQIQPRPNQPWARCSVRIPPPPAGANISLDGGTLRHHSSADCVCAKQERGSSVLQHSAERGAGHAADWRDCGGRFAGADWGRGAVGADRWGGIRGGHRLGLPQRLHGQAPGGALQLCIETRASYAIAPVF